MLGLWSYIFHRLQQSDWQSFCTVVLQRKSSSHFATHSNLHILPLIYLLPLFPPLSCVGIVSNRFVELANEKIGVFKQCSPLTLWVSEFHLKNSNN